MFETTHSLTMKIIKTLEKNQINLHHILLNNPGRSLTQVKRDTYRLIRKLMCHGSAPERIIFNLMKMMAVAEDAIALSRYNTFTSNFQAKMKIIQVENMNTRIFLGFLRYVRENSRSIEGKLIVNSIKK